MCVSALRQVQNNKADEQKSCPPACFFCEYAVLFYSESDIHTLVSLIMSSGLLKFT